MDVVITDWPVLQVFLNVPVLFYIVILGLGFLLVGFWVRSPFVYLAVLLCMLTLLFSGEFSTYPWLQMAFGFVGLWAILATVKTIMVRGGEG